MAQLKHSRRRRMEDPPSTPRESRTLLSPCPQKGQRKIPPPRTIFCASCIINLYIWQCLSLPNALTSRLARLLRQHECSRLPASPFDALGLRPKTVLPSEIFRGGILTPGAENAGNGACGKEVAALKAPRKSIFQHGLARFSGPNHLEPLRY